MDAAVPVASSPYLSWLSANLRPTERPVFGGSGPSKAVFGYATGYGAATLEPFVRSLRACFEGEIVLAVDDRPDVRDLAARFRVVTAGAAVGGWAPHPVVQRFAAYDQWLTERPWIRDVLLTDVRDVIFQGDPFAGPANGLEVFTESENSSLGDHAFNRKHLRALVGDSLARSVTARACICVGTVLGPAGTISRFCRTLLMLAAIPRSEVGGAFGADQAACNLAVHLGLVDARIQPNFGRVATIGDQPSDRLRLNEEGLILNPDGSVSPIVHQYDRHPHLSEVVRLRWGREEHDVFRARRKTLGDRRRKFAASLGRRLPELR